MRASARTAPAPPSASASYRRAHAQRGREQTPMAALSRAVAGVRGKVLIVNLPGSPRGAVESLDAIVELVPHVLELLRGITEHASAPERLARS
jgi:molybdopterin biosynthesis enzyme MoaB